MTRRYSYLEWVAAVALGSQRLNIRLPKVIRRLLRSLVARLSESKGSRAGVEDWSGPLIARSDRAMDGCANATFEATVETDTTRTAADLRVCDTKPETALAAGGRAPLGSHVALGLRCVLVTSCLDAGGMDEVVVFLARRLPHHGVHTAVLHASSEGTSDGVARGRLGRLLLEQGVETVELSEAAGSRWLEAWRPDVVSAHGAPAWVLEAAVRLSIPYVDTLHGMHSLFGASREHEADRGSKLAGVVAVSDLVRRQYLDLNPAFSTGRVVSIPNGVDDWRRIPGNRVRARTALGIRDEYLFVSLARHCLQKNTYGLMAAFDDVATRHPEAHLLVAGRPDDAVYVAQSMRLRERLGCRKRLHIRDHVSSPSELLAAADGFVLDSFFEGWSLASMEALHAGVPVVVSEVGGAVEQVGRDGKRGHVVPNPLGDPLRVNWTTIRDARYARQVNREALVGAMSVLIADRRSWLGERQRLMAEAAERFHPDRCLRMHARVLEAAANGEAELKRTDVDGHAWVSTERSGFARCDRESGR